MTAANIIADLPELRWRTFAAPCEQSSYKGSHAQAKRGYPFVDGNAHDWTGRNSYEIPATRLHFINTIKPKDWYPTRWNQFREALENGKPGPLDHPDLGAVQAVVLTWDVDLKASNRGGVVVDVSWEETIESLDERVVYLGPDITPGAAAEAADTAMAALGIVYPTGKGNTSFVEGIRQIEGFALSTRVTVQGAINQVKGTIVEVMRSADRTHAHAAWLLHGHLVALWDGLRSIANEAKLTSRATATARALTDTTLDALARQYGNTTKDMMGLNLDLLRSPTVKRGALVTYFSGSVDVNSPLKRLLP